MKVSDLDVPELLGVINKALSPVLFRGVDQHSAPHLWRERVKLNAEITGRIMAVLHCGDEVGPDIRELIELCTRHTQTSYGEEFSWFFGPGGALSRSHMEAQDGGAGKK